MHNGDVRAELQRVIPDLTDAEWAWAEKKNYVADCIEDLENGVVDAISRLAQEVRMLPSRAGDLPTAPRMVGEALTRGRDKRASGSRMDALSVLLAQRAARETGVEGFRRDVLDSKLLEPGDVHPWIKELAAKDGAPSKWLSAPPAIPEGTHTKWEEGFVLTFSPPLAIRSLDPRKGENAGLSRRTLAFGVPGSQWEQVVLVRNGGILDRLRRLSEDLASRYQWQAAQATLFILTGSAPLLQTIRVDAPYRWPLTSMTRITLEVDPTVTPQEVADAYRRARKAVIPGKARPISDKHARLALFAAKQPDGASWAQQLATWNAVNPNWSYRHLGTFKRDARVAQERLLQPNYGPQTGRVKAQKGVANDGE